MKTMTQGMLSRNAMVFCLPLALLATALPACSAADSGADGDEARDDALTVGGVAEGGPEAVGILQLVNESSVGDLERKIGLERGIAIAMVPFESRGTRYRTLAELMQVLKTKARTEAKANFDKIRTYASKNGYRGGSTKPICYADSWCWYHPLATIDWSRVRGSSATDVWMVGEQGMVGHWDGSALTKVSFPARYGSPNFTDVWPLGPNDVWATAGYDDTANELFHWNGTTWTQASLGAFPKFCPATILAFASNDVWVAGPSTPDALEGGMAVLHFDGTSWSVAPTKFLPGRARDLTGFFGTSTSNMFFLTDDDQLYKWNGSAFTPGGTFPHHLHEPRGGFFANPTTFWLVDTYDVYRSDFATRNTTQQAQGLLPNAPAGSSVESVGGTSTSDVWLGGSFGGMYHFDGMSWKQALAPATVTDANMYSVWAASPDDVWAVGYEGQIIRRKR